ncbi:MAG: nucleotidyltransferase family protein [Deltaproteobacteria bacterium]|nr:nucleotidyltransferase family protein [Deltaproteobacteria bacterium]
MINESLDRALSRWGVELHFLLACCRFSPSDREIETIRDLSREVVDWERFLALVRRHRVHPVVYRNVYRYTREYVPEPVVQTLKARFQENLLATLRLSAELTRVSQLLEKSGIPALCLKGPVLSFRLFGDVAWRHYGDVDILIGFAELNQADQILMAAGYRQVSPGFDLAKFTPRARNHVRINNKHLEYKHQKLGTMIELHWNPFRNMAPSLMAENTRRFFDACVFIPVGGVPIRSLTDEEMMLHLCEHGAEHAWFRLKWLWDISELVGRLEGINWKTLMDTAAARDLSRSVTMSLWLAHRLFGSCMPQPVASTFKRDPFLPELMDFFIQAMDKPEAAFTVRGSWNEVWLTFNRMRLKRNPQSKWALFKGLWFQIRDFRDFSLPDGLFPIYPLLRPFLWFKRYHLSRNVSHKTKDVRR